MYEHKRTGQLLPILIGVTMEDPSGSGQEVPVLGVEKDKTSGNMVPLGGTHEDPEGQGLVAIKLGAKAVDVVTGELSPISGVRRDPTSDQVVAVTLSSSSGNRKRKAPIGAQALLEEEVAARRSFWRRQREREAEVTSLEFLLAVRVLFHTDKVNFSRLDGELQVVLERAHDLDAAAKREWQRRGTAEQEMATTLPPDILAVLTEGCSSFKSHSRVTSTYATRWNSQMLFCCTGDEAEVKCESDHDAAHRKLVEIVRKFVSKLDAARTRYEGRIAELDGAMNAEAENMAHERYEQERIRLQVPDAVFVFHLIG